VKIVVQESHLGEFETTTEDEFARKLERGIEPRNFLVKSWLLTTWPKFWRGHLRPD